MMYRPVIGQLLQKRSFHWLMTTDWSFLHTKELRSHYLFRTWEIVTIKVRQFLSSTKFLLIVQVNVSFYFRNLRVCLSEVGVYRKDIPPHSPCHHLQLPFTCCALCVLHVYHQQIIIVCVTKTKEKIKILNSLHSSLILPFSHIHTTLKQQLSMFEKMFVH